MMITRHSIVKRLVHDDVRMHGTKLVSLVTKRWWVQTCIIALIRILCDVMDVGMQDTASINLSPNSNREGKY